MRLITVCRVHGFLLLQNLLLIAACCGLLRLVAAYRGLRSLYTTLRKQSYCCLLLLITACCGLLRIIAAEGAGEKVAEYDAVAQHRCGFGRQWDFGAAQQHGRIFTIGTVLGRPCGASGGRSG